MKSITENNYINSFGLMSSKFGYKNSIQLPKIKFISLNVAIKAIESDAKTITYVASQLSNIAGQKAVITYAKKAISTFKLRKDLPIGCKVTLRGKKMYLFLDKLINISLPRIRDFRGLSSKGFNESFHYSFGIKDQSIFLEVDTDSLQKVFGMNITLGTDAKTKEEALSLLKVINLPIK